MLRARNETRGTIVATHLEVAGTLWTKFLGLMGRGGLPAGHGLWLPGETGIHMFFMRVPIDALFLGRPTAEGGRPVVATRTGLRPWTGIVLFIRGADGVIEVPAGTVMATATQRGDLVILESWAQ